MGPDEQHGDFRHCRTRIMRININVKREVHLVCYEKQLWIEYVVNFVASSYKTKFLVDDL
jgi:hypothetical protein